MKNEILDTILSGMSDKNMRFEDLRKLFRSLNFDERIKGVRHIFTKIGSIEILNLQPLKDGKAKTYQVKQIRNNIKIQDS
jgi:hypothetical protein